LISGQRKPPTAEPKSRTYLEQRYGDFHKRLRVPEGTEASTISARLRNGILDVHVPYPKDTKEKDRVKVKIG